MYVCGYMSIYHIEMCVYVYIHIYIYICTYTRTVYTAGNKMGTVETAHIIKALTVAVAASLKPIK